MPKLTARDIKERSNNLRIISETPASVNIKTLFKHVKSQYSYNNAKTVLENWRGLSRDESVSFQQVLELFQLICDNDSPSHIKNASELIEGKILHKVRDGKALRLPVQRGHFEGEGLGPLRLLRVILFGARAHAQCHSRNQHQEHK